MNNFLKRFVIFIICFNVVFFTTLIVSSLMVKRKNNFRIKNDSKYILMGHSHSECAYNDHLIKNLENFSHSGESYFYTLPKVVQLVEYNPNIKTVFIEFTNNQITQEIKNWIIGKKYLNYYYPTYFPYLDFTDHFYLIKEAPMDYLKNIPVLFKDLIKNSFQLRKVPYEYGGYKPIKGELIEYKKKNKKNHDTENFISINPGISVIQINFLTEIIEFLNSKNIQTILIRSPQHKSYEGFKNENDFNKVLKDVFSDVFFIDLVNFPLLQDEYRDPEHVNKNGSEKISIWLNSLIQNNIFNIFKNKNHLSYQDIEDIKQKRKT